MYRDAGPDVYTPKLNQHTYDGPRIRSWVTGEFQYTRAQNQAIGDRIDANGGQATNGFNNRGGEQSFPNPDGSRSGGRFSDGSAVDADGNPFQVQTIDTKANGSLTGRESSAARDIAERVNQPVVCVSKASCN